VAAVVAGVPAVAAAVAADAANRAGKFPVIENRGRAQLRARPLFSLEHAPLT
jgi:hypothetical protein